MFPRLMVLLLIASAASMQVPGTGHGALRPAGAAGVLIFVTSDCPISNGYAPEIQRICKAYAAKGARCELIYEDLDITADAVKKHLEDYRYGATPASIDHDAAMAASIDKDGSLARKVGATMTPEAVVIDRGGAVKYRGRIDNQYASLGHPRRVVTEHDLQDALDAVIAGKPVATPQTEAIGCYIVSPEMRRK